MKLRSSKSRKKARLSKRQRRLYLNILKAVKECDTKLDTWAWQSWAGHNTASCAYHFAKRWGGRKDVDIVKLQTAVCKFGSADIIYKFARDIPEANINRLQYEIIKQDDPFWIRVFADNIPGAKKEMLERIAFIAEIMEDMA